MPRPACAKCGIEYRPETNDVVVELMASFGSYQLWCADLWKCPICGHLLLTGYGQRAWAQHFEPDYARKLEIAKGKSVFPIMEKAPKEE